MKMSAVMEGVLLGLGLLASVIGAASITIIVPQFMELLSQMGSDLPLFTRLVVHYFWVVWLLPFVVIAVWFMWSNRQERSVAALSVGVGVTIIFAVMCVFGLYWPIWQMGQVVGG